MDSDLKQFFNKNLLCLSEPTLFENFLHLANAQLGPYRSS